MADCHSSNHHINQQKVTNMNTSITNTDWHMKDGVLTFVDTGEQWEVSHWSDRDFDYLVSSDSDTQLQILSNLNNLDEFTEGDNQ
jgi:hypothetical protein